jgi:hypothetical protein
MEPAMNRLLQNKARQGLLFRKLGPLMGWTGKPQQEFKDLQLWRRLARRILLGAVAWPVLVASALGAGALYSTFLGGMAGEEAGHVAVDESGNVYITGTTFSPDFPTTAGGDQTLAGNSDAFVTKFAPDGTPIYSTLVGGSCDEEGHAITVDAAGCAYISGRLANCNYLDAPSGAMVAKLDPAGRLVYLYTIGSRLLDMTVATAIAVDREGNAYVTGSSLTSFNLPTTPDAFEATSCGGLPAHGFVAKVNATGTGLVYCTYLCGSGEDSPTAIAVDSIGNAYVAGATVSRDFPTRNAYQSSHRGGINGLSGFLTKLNSSGSDLVFSTYFGGTYQTAINDLVLDAEGNIYVTGVTVGEGFPTTAGVVQPNGPSPLCYYGGICADAFVTKFGPEGSVVYSTLVGGEGQDEAAGIAVDEVGDVYIVGSTASTVFPLCNAVQVGIQGPDDAFLVKLNHDASRILFSSYLGGGKLAASSSRTEGSDDAVSVALGPGGQVWLTGYTTSFGYPVTADAWQPTSTGVSCILWGEPCGDLFVTGMTVEGPSIAPACHLEVAPTELRPGNPVTAHWAGIPAPSSEDRLMLFQLGRVADIWLFVPTFPTTGEAEGFLSLSLPNDLTPGTYELRLMVPNPDVPALHKVIARSEPLTVTAPGLVTLVPILGDGKAFRIQIMGSEPGTYKVEATQTLASPDWHTISILTIQPGETPEFSVSIDSVSQACFYRLSK